jgi:hypothetical protein
MPTEDVHPLMGYGPQRARRRKLSVSCCLSTLVPAHGLSTVVPAKAVTQYSREFVATSESNRTVCIYWVPAFAGTTAESADSASPQIVNVSCVEG